MTTPLTTRSRLTYCAHLFKALFRQHHGEIKPQLRRFIPPDGIVFDVGAHAGQFTKIFASLVPQGRVYAFEPGQYALSILRKVCAWHGLKNVALVSQGLGDRPSTAVLQVPIKRSGSIGFGLSTLGKFEDGRATHADAISVTTIDQFVAENSITRLDFIKADIEGWELRMLEGGAQSIVRFSPVIFLEVNDLFLRRANDSRERLLDFLASRGYAFFRQQGDDIVPLAGSDDKNVYCVPKTRQFNL